MCNFDPWSHLLEQAKTSSRLRWLQAVCTTDSWSAPIAAEVQGTNISDATTHSKISGLFSFLKALMQHWALLYRDFNACRLHETTSTSTEQSGEKTVILETAFFSRSTRVVHFYFFLLEVDWGGVFFFFTELLLPLVNKYFSDWTHLYMWHISELFEL